MEHHVLLMFGLIMRVFQRDGGKLRRRVCASLRQRCAAMLNAPVRYACVCLKMAKPLPSLLMLRHPAMNRKGANVARNYYQFNPPADSRGVSGKWAGGGGQYRTQKTSGHCRQHLSGAGHESPPRHAGGLRGHRVEKRCVLVCVRCVR